MFWKQISSSIWGDGRHPEALRSQNALPRAAHPSWPYYHEYYFYYNPICGLEPSKSLWIWAPKATLLSSVAVTKGRRSPEAQLAALEHCRPLLFTWGFPKMGGHQLIHTAMVHGMVLDQNMAALNASNSTKLGSAWCQGRIPLQLPSLQRKQRGTA